MKKQKLFLICGLLLLANILIAQSAINYTYDQQNRTQLIEYPNGSSISYTYDAIGNRLTQTISTSPLAPQANFTANPTSGTVPLQVTFTDASVPGSNPITSLQWDFNNDGVYDTSGQGPHIYTYTSAGTYSVKLRVSDGTLYSEHIKQDYITVTPTANQPPIVQNTIPNQNLFVGGSSFTRDLEVPPVVFFDPDGDSLNYTVSSSNTLVAIATISQILYKINLKPPLNETTKSIDTKNKTSEDKLNLNDSFTDGGLNGSLLTVSPISEGNAIITVTADDGRGGIISTYLDVTVSPEPILTFPLSVTVINGWNMVSVPGMHPYGMHVDYWWPYRTGAVWGFNGSQYVFITIATPGESYWMKNFDARTYNTGDEWPANGIQVVPHEPLNGVAGWNFIGGYEISATASAVTTIPPGLIQGPIYKYNGGYQLATTLDPGYGYWVKLTGAGQIIISETLAEGEKTAELEPGTYYKRDQSLDNNYAEMKFVGEKSFAFGSTDFAVNLWVNGYCTGGANLIFGTAPDATNGFDPGYDCEAPPYPPAGAFDARFGGLMCDFRQTNFDSQINWHVSFQRVTGCPVIFSWEPSELPPYGYFYLVDIYSGEINMRTQSSYTISSPSLTFIDIKYQNPPSPENWLKQMALQDAGGTDSGSELQFGQRPNATNGIDTTFGEQVLSPIPPTGTFDARFILPTVPEVGSIIDFRSNTETVVTWTLTFQPGPAGYPMTFSWDTLGFPSGTFLLTDVINGTLINVNMRNQTSYTITDPSITSIYIKYQRPTTFQLEVNVADGWNMVSAPGLHPTDQNVSTWWPHKTGTVWGFNGVQYVAKTVTTPGEGYWMKNTLTETYSYPAIQIVPHNPIPVTLGWNMIGGYETSPTIVSLKAANPQITGTVWGFNGVQYVAAVNLVPGYGYWVKSTAAGTITIPNAFTKDGSGEAVAENFNSSWGRIVITDAEGRSNTLYAVNGEVDLDQYELPPMPPSGTFDVRYGSGRIAEDINSSVKTIDMSGIAYPITVRVEGMDMRLMDESEKVVNVNLKSGEDVVINDATINKLKVTSELLPTVYAIEQNYPNPFNPSTKIRFSIPKESQVNLSVFNILGERVVELKNEVMKPDYYEVEFNASDLASGIYIYRIMAGDFVESKKMIFIK